MDRVRQGTVGAVTVTEVPVPADRRVRGDVGKPGGKRRRAGGRIRTDHHPHRVIDRGDISEDVPRCVHEIIGPEIVADSCVDDRVITAVVVNGYTNTAVIGGNTIGYGDVLRVEEPDSDVLIIP